MRCRRGGAERRRRLVRSGVQAVEVDGVERLALGQQHGALDQVPQLAHVARPGIGQERRFGLVGQAADRLAEFPAEDA